jgi:hypothetical protein
VCRVCAAAIVVLAGRDDRGVLPRRRQRHEERASAAVSDLAGDMRGQRPTDRPSGSASDVAVDRAAAELAKFTWRQIFDKPMLVITQVAQALALRAAAGAVNGGH